MVSISVSEAQRMRNAFARGMTMGTTTFVWDPVFDCVSHDLDENNDVKAVYHNEPQQYGGVLSQRRGTTSHYHHHDALGSTRFLTDTSGNVADTYLHDAWGNTVASTGTTVNPFKWVGKYGYYTDDSTGQVYVRARMYQPTVASWMSVDPLSIDMRLLFEILDKGFHYAANSGTLCIDPSGRLCHKEPCEDCDASLASFPDVDSLKQCLNKLNCKFDATCVKCNNNEQDGIVTNGCTVLNNNDVIVLRQCCDKRTTAQLIQTWTHELLHAVRLCRKLKQEIRQPYNSCLGCLEEEIASYACSGQWEKKSPKLDAAELIKMAIRSCQSGDGSPRDGKPTKPIPHGPCKGETPHKDFNPVGCTNAEVKEIGNGDLFLSITQYVIDNYKTGKKSDLCKKYLSCEDVQYPVIQPGVIQPGVRQ